MNPRFPLSGAREFPEYISSDRKLSSEFQIQRHRTNIPNCTSSTKEQFVVQRFDCNMPSFHPCEQVLVTIVSASLCFFVSLFPNNLINGGSKILVIGPTELPDAPSALFVSSYRQKWVKLFLQLSNPINVATPWFVLTHY